MRNGEKIAVTIVMIILLLIVGFYGTVFITLMGGAQFLTPLFIIAVIGTMIIVILGIFKVFMTKKLVIITVSFYTLCIATYIGYEIYQNHIADLKIMSQQDVDLSKYEPFAENTKVVMLEEEATFKLEDELITIDGATAFYPMYSAFARAVYPEKEYPYYDSEVMSNQTDGAYWNLIDGLVDLIFAFEPSDEHWVNARIHYNTRLILHLLVKKLSYFLSMKS